MSNTISPLSLALVHACNIRFAAQAIELLNLGADPFVCHRENDEQKSKCPVVLCASSPLLFNVLTRMLQGVQYSSLSTSKQNILCKALYRACFVGNKIAISYLIEQINVNPFGSSAPSSSSSSITNALESAAIGGEFEVITYLLEEQKTFSISTSHVGKPISFAAKALVGDPSRYITTIRVLMSHGVTVNTILEEVNPLEAILLETFKSGSISIELMNLLEDLVERGNRIRKSAFVLYSQGFNLSKTKLDPEDVIGLMDWCFEYVKSCQLSRYWAPCPLSDQAVEDNSGYECCILFACACDLFMGLGKLICFPRFRSRSNKYKDARAWLLTFIFQFSRFIDLESNAIMNNNSRTTKPKLKPIPDMYKHKEDDITVIFDAVMAALWVEIRNTNDYPETIALFQQMKKANFMPSISLQK